MASLRFTDVQTRPPEFLDHQGRPAVVEPAVPVADREGVVNARVPLAVAALVRDLDRFVAEIREKDGFATPDIAVVAQSVGAVIAASRK